MIQTAIILIILTGVLTVWVVIRRGERSVKVKAVAPLYGGMACLLIAAVFGTIWFLGQRDYDACISKVERSKGNHAQTVQFYDTIDVLTGTTKYTSEPVLPGLPSLRDSLDLNLPLLDTASCPRP